MPKTAVFIVPNNQSQEFMVTKSRDGGDPDYVYSVIQGYDTEAKARALCKLGEFNKVNYPLEAIREVPDGLRPKKVKFSLASGYRTLINRPEYFDCDYFYYFTKGRWLWADNPYAIYDYIKDGTLSMCDGFLDVLEADAVKLIGDPDTLARRHNEDASVAYEALQDPRKFREWFHFQLGEYIDFFQKSKLKYFYRPWIDKNEKGVAEIVRSNLLGLLKAAKAEKKVAAMRESANVDEYTDEDLLAMSDEEFNGLLFDGQTVDFGGKPVDYEGARKAFHILVDSAHELAKGEYMDGPFDEDRLDGIVDRVTDGVMSRINSEFGSDASIDDVYDLLEAFRFDFPDVVDIVFNVPRMAVFGEGVPPGTVNRDLLMVKMAESKSKFPNTSDGAKRALISMSVYGEKDIKGVYPDPECDGVWLAELADDAGDGNVAIVYLAGYGLNKSDDFETGNLSSGDLDKLKRGR